MSDQVRAFFGVPVASQPALRDVLDSLTGFGRVIKPVRPGNLHVTLKFLGGIPLPAVTELAAAMGPELRGVSGSVHELEGLGVFPDLRRPSVVWAGITEPAPLLQLAEVIESVCSRLGYPKESRPYRAHLTLARVNGRPPAGLREFIEVGENQRFGRLNIDKVVLYQSELAQGGSRYTALATWQLTQ